MIQIEGEGSTLCEAVCVLSTSQVPGSIPLPASSQREVNANSNSRKRTREESERPESRLAIKVPLKAAIPAPGSDSVTRLSSMAPPKSPARSQRVNETPLFFPASQMSLRDIDEATGLDLESMDREELEAMIDGGAADLDWNVEDEYETRTYSDGGGFTQSGTLDDKHPQKDGGITERDPEEPSGRENSLDLIDDDVAVVPQTQSWETSDAIRVSISEV